MQQIATNIHVSAIKSIHSIRVVTLFTSEVVGSKQSNQILPWRRSSSSNLTHKKQQVGIPDAFEWPIKSVSEGENYCWNFAQQDLTGVIGSSSDVRHSPVERKNHHLHLPEWRKRTTSYQVSTSVYFCLSLLSDTQDENLAEPRTFLLLSGKLWERWWANVPEDCSDSYCQWWPGWKWNSCFASPSRPLSAAS